MTEPYAIEAVDQWVAASEESLGTKRKTWLRDPSGRLWLFKESRGDAGDDWSEKVAAELATLLLVPHPRVELATRHGVRGSVSLSFNREELDSFVPGNELMWILDPKYRREQRHKLPAYTVDRCINTLRRFSTSPPWQVEEPIMGYTGAEVFVGYLLLDAWIGNQDRHHENWGLVNASKAYPSEPLRIAPSYDHASSLGQNLLDVERELRLDGNDLRARIDRWARRARTPFYLRDTDTKPLTTFEAFHRAAELRPRAGAEWVTRLASVNSASVERILEAVPESLMSSLTRRFAHRLLLVDQEALCTSSST